MRCTEAGCTRQAVVDVGDVRRIAPEVRAQADAVRCHAHDDDITIASLCIEHAGVTFARIDAASSQTVGLADDDHHARAEANIDAGGWYAAASGPYVQRQRADTPDGGPDAVAIVTALCITPAPFEERITGRVLHRVVPWHALGNTMAALALFARYAPDEVTLAVGAMGNAPAPLKRDSVGVTALIAAHKMSGGIAGRSMTPERCKECNRVHPLALPADPDGTELTPGGIRATLAHLCERFDVVLDSAAMQEDGLPYGDDSATPDADALLAQVFGAGAGIVTPSRVKRLPPPMQ